MRGLRPSGSSYSTNFAFDVQKNGSPMRGLRRRVHRAFPPAMFGVQKNGSPMRGLRLAIEGGDWVRVTFAEKPERSVLSALKAAGFRWRGGSWIGERAKLPAEVMQG